MEITSLILGIAIRSVRNLKNNKINQLLRKHIMLLTI